MSATIAESNRIICKFNLRGKCRFGSRCRNIHSLEELSDAQSETTATSTRFNTYYEQRPQTPDEELSDECLGACARISPRKPAVNSPSQAQASHSRFLDLGPSTSTVEEAVALVKQAESAERTCGICLDTIMEKPLQIEKFFGILPNCNHCFCFPCIKKWRQNKEVDVEVARACPECRTTSEFVYRSKHWITNKEEKEDYIQSHNDRMKKMNCRFYRQGRGRCPFGNTCLYRHSLRDGTLVDVGPPSSNRRRSEGSGLVNGLLYWVNDEDDDDDDDDLDADDDDDYEDDDFDLDDFLSDPYMAIQYYDKDDYEYYVAMEQIANYY